MSEKLNITLSTETNIAVSSNSQSIELNEVSPEPSCSKDFVGFKCANIPHNFNSEEIEEKNVVSSSNFSYSSGNILSNFSSYEIYDENNNCMLTNLNKFGLRYFNITVDNNEEADYTSDDIDPIFECLTTKEDNSNSMEDELKEINSNDIFCIFDLDEISNHPSEDGDNKTSSYNHLFQQSLINNGVSEYSREYINIICDDSWEQNDNDIEKHLKCNLISKICISEPTKDIQSNEENTNDCILSKTVNEVLNEEVANIDSDNKNIVITESKDCLLENNKEIDNDPDKTESDESDACSYHSSDFEFIDEEEASKECKLNISDHDNMHGLDSDCLIEDYFTEPKLLNTSIPYGNDCYNLFLRPNVPDPCLNMENKAVTSLSLRGMEVSPGPTINKDTMILEEAKYKKEADESIKIILSMYPNENRIPQRST